MQYETYARIRDAKGLKDADVARGTGLSPVVFSEWKRGKSSPKIDKIQKITEYLGEPVEVPAFDNSESKYYVDEETAEIMQQLLESPGRRALFKAVGSMDEDTVRKYAQFIEGITNDNNKSS